MSAERVDGRTLRFQHRRPELLAAATEYVLDHGITGLSLRPVAQAVGVTHATLLRHFSSKDELVKCVLEKICTDLFDQVISDREHQEAASTAQLLRITWRRLCEPKEQRQFRLLFEMVAAHGGRSGDRGELARFMDDEFIVLISGSLTQDGWAPEEASALATLLLAQVRGLQLELLVSGDRARVDRAFEFALTLVEPRTSPSV
jgi:AcrR family transcriptional regulator